jgi:hypothetical protein
MDRFPIIYETPLWRRLKSIIFVLAMGTCCPCIGIICGVIIWAIGIFLGLQQIPSIMLGIVALLFFLHLTWNICAPTLRFNICLQTDYAELGRGFFKKVFPYEQVDFIYMPEADEHDHGVGLERNGVGAFVFLSIEHELLCLNMLREKCINAIFVDSRDCEYLPDESDNPARVLWKLYHRKRGKIWATLCALVFAGIFTIARTITICLFIMGQNKNIPFDQIIMCFVEILLGFSASFGALVYLRNSLNELRTIKMHIAEAHE